MTTIFTSTDFLWLQPHLSMGKVMMFWNTAMTVDRAAKDMNTKNSAPHRRPRGMALNTLGRVMKIRLGPLSGWMPKAKAEGKITRPTTKATKVSRMPTLMASPMRRCSLPM